MLVANIRPALLCLLLTIKIALAPACIETASWSDKTLSKLSVEDQVAQLMMVRVYTDEKHNNVDQIADLVSNYSIGGLIWMNGTISAQQHAYNKLQALSNIPLICAQDNEWGLSLRLPDGMRFPRNLTLGAIRNEDLIYQMGQEVARQCQAVGVHVNFAPVVDINNNPQNTVINDRSFGENAKDVSRKSLQMMRGLQSQPIMACAKHFPGHGDTCVDSHYALPVIHKSTHELTEIEWVPFQNLIKHDLKSVMLGHIHFPQISADPSSLSTEVIQKILQKKMNFKGLIFSDSLVMKAVTNKQVQGALEYKAFLAGNDMLVGSLKPKQAIEYIVNQVKQNPQVTSLLQKRVLKILQAKEKLDLHQDRALKDYPLFSEKAQKLKARLFKEAITAYPQKAASLQVDIQNQKVAFLQIGNDVAMKDALEQTLEPYQPNDHCKEKPPLYQALNQQSTLDYYYFPKSSHSHCGQELLNQLSHYDHVIIGLYQLNKYASKNYGVSKSTLEITEALKGKSTLCIFGSPYALKLFGNYNEILMAYENDIDAQIGCGEILLGERQALGALPITVATDH